MVFTCAMRELQGKRHACCCALQYSAAKKSCNTGKNYEKFFHAAYHRVLFPGKEQGKITVTLHVLSRKALHKCNFILQLHGKRSAKTCQHVFLLHDNYALYKHALALSGQ